MRWGCHLKVTTFDSHDCVIMAGSVNNYICQWDARWGVLPAFRLGLQTCELHPCSMANKHASTKVELVRRGSLQHKRCSCVSTGNEGSAVQYLMILAEILVGPLMGLSIFKPAF